MAASSRRLGTTRKVRHAPGVRASVGATRARGAAPAAVPQLSPATGEPCRAIIFSAPAAPVGSSLGPVWRADRSDCVRYSCRSCISRSRAATADLRPDSSTTGEQPSPEAHGRSRAGLQAGCEGHGGTGERRSTSCCGRLSASCTAVELSAASSCVTELR